MKKPNKLMSGYNVMWESSRMMLPEHVEALLQQEKESHKKQMPIYDEQMFRLIDYILVEAYETGCNVKVTSLGEYEDLVSIGKVTKIDKQARKIKMKNEDDINWVNIDEIIDIDKVL